VYCGFEDFLERGGGVAGGGGWGGTPYEDAAVVGGGCEDGAEFGMGLGEDRCQKLGERGLRCVVYLEE
jgi:hypothetical protein